MQITLAGKNIEITQAIRDYVETHIGKVEKYIEGMSPVSVAVEISSKSIQAKGEPSSTVEVTMHIPDFVIRCEETSSDLYEAIDIVQAKVERKLRIHKEKLLRSRREVDDFDVQDVKRIIKRKKFDLGSPLTEDEAIMRMDLLGHDFFVFIDKETSRQKTVYKRKDGGYGVIAFS